ncbi:MAG: RtcB family protein [Paludibacteraceae bacterium]|nr:RtcB family protein [Paludibacteraceae bacterium]
MLEIVGKYTKANVYADTIENECISQLYSLCNHPVFKDCNVAIMPDCHAGAGCVVGFTSQLPKNGEIIPNIIGVDISCGMYVVKLKDSPLLNDYEKLDKVIRQNVPSGFNGNTKISKFLPDDVRERIEDVCWNVLGEKANDHLLKVGSLGGGNHFISIEKGETGTYLIIHSGSRNFGLKVCKHFQSIAKQKHPFGDMSYIDGDDAKEYMRCAEVCREYAHWSRKIMANTILVGMRWREEEHFETLHNYIGNDNIIRKGAISCNEGEKVLIPLNMRDGSLICIGKGIAEWNNSGPHGAGRILSRSKAKETISMDDYKKSMEGIWTSCVGTSTLDESPMAYKSADEIKNLVLDTAELVDHLKPLYNFKANDEITWKERKKYEKEMKNRIKEIEEE